MVQAPPVNILPLFPLRGALLLPMGHMPLNIFEPRYLAMIDNAFANQRIIGMVQPLWSPERQQGINGLCTIGCIGRIMNFHETEDKRYLITLKGLFRFKIISEKETTTPFRQAHISTHGFEKDYETDGHSRTINKEKLLKLFQSFIQKNNLHTDWNEIQKADTITLVNALSMMCPHSPAEKQALLEADTLDKRAELLMTLMKIEQTADQAKIKTSLQ